MIYRILLQFFIRQVPAAPCSTSVRRKLLQGPRDSCSPCVDSRITSYCVHSRLLGCELVVRRIVCQFPTGVTFYLFSRPSRPALGPTQSSIQWIREASFPRGKVARTWS